MVGQLVGVSVCTQIGRVSSPAQQRRPGLREFNFFLAFPCLWGEVPQSRMIATVYGIVSLHAKSSLIASTVNKNIEL